MLGLTKVTRTVCLETIQMFNCLMSSIHEIEWRIYPKLQLHWSVGGLLDFYFFHNNFDSVGSIWQLWMEIMLVANFLYLVILGEWWCQLVDRWIWLKHKFNTSRHLNGTMILGKQHHIENWKGLVKKKIFPGSRRD